MKKARNTAIPYNKLVPIEMQGIQPANGDDCFGIEYDATSKVCAVCADNEVCATLLLAKNTRKGETFLDSVDIDALTDEWLTATIKELAGEPLTSLFEEAAKHSRCPDEIAVKNRILAFKKITPEFKVKGGTIRWEA